MGDKRVQAGAAAGFGVVGSVTVSTRHYLASQHLWSALHSARLCSELEAQHAGGAPVPGSFPIEHRARAIDSVLAAVAFLEALVNEVFQDATDTKQGTTNPRIVPLGEQCIALMSEFWKASRQGERYMNVLDKYQMTLLFANKPKLDAGANPYQDAELLIGIRNKLVHFRPESLTHGEGDERKFEKKLAERIIPNALVPGTSRWFPDKCLGAGCANFACTTIRSLADDWTDRLGLPRSYESDLNSYPAP